jgi:hypothetical protein
MLGCEELGNRAATLEALLREPSRAQSVAVVEAALAALADYLQEVMADLAKWAQTLPATPPPQAESPELLDEAATLTAIAAVADLLDTDLVSAIAAVKQLQLSLQRDKAATALIAVLTTALDNFDTEQALRILRQLAQLVESQL